MSRNPWSRTVAAIGVVVTMTWVALGCTPAPAPVQQVAGSAAERVDEGFDAMRAENERRIREIAESSREMEAERERVLEAARK